MLTTADAMQPEVETVGPGVGLIELERRFMTLGRTGFPVVAEGRLVGVVSRSDVIRVLAIERSHEEQRPDFYRAFENPSAGGDADAKAIAARGGRRAAGLTPRDAMSRNVVSVRRDQPLDEVARLMLDAHIHRLPVVDDAGKLVGLVTTLDIVRLLAEGRLVEAKGDVSPEKLLS